MYQIKTEKKHVQNSDGLLNPDSTSSRDKTSSRHLKDN